MSIKFTSPLKQIIPANVKGVLKESRFWLRYTSNCINVYHDCVHKTASHTINILNCWGLFAALRSWMTAFNRDKNIQLFRFEELTAPNNFELFKELLLHCDIRIADNILIRLLQDYSFSKITNGRQQGQEDRYSHLRKGVPNDWKNYFNDEIAQKLEKATGDLVMQLGYK